MARQTVRTPPPDPSQVNLNNSASLTFSQSFSHVQKLIKTAQFYWFLSHVFALTYMVLNTITSILYTQSSYTATKYYNYSINSIIITYLIVLRQTYKSKPISFIFSQLISLLRDDNVQYLLLALSFKLFVNIGSDGMNSSTLYPFSIFALFHALTYFNSNILQFLPVLNKSVKLNASGSINKFVKNYNERSLLIASNLEIVLILIYLQSFLKNLIFLQFLKLNSLKNTAVLLSVVVFNKLRFNQNKYTKLLVNNYDLKLNQFIFGSTFLPNNVKSYLSSFRVALINQLDKIRIPNQNTSAKKRN